MFLICDGDAGIHAALMNFRITSLALVAMIAPAFCQDKTAWTQKDGDGFRDVLADGKTVLRHMNAWDPARRDETYKPFLHVFDFAGEKPITKGPGGQFTHHRGAFIGWNKTSFGGKTYDFWHCKGVERKHVKYLDSSKDGTLVSVTEWPTPEGKVVISETQTVRSTKLADGSVQLDFGFRLEAPNGPVKLEGDVQHAGFHFRAAEEVQKTAKETKYTIPEGATQVTNDKGKVTADVYENTNWVVCSFVIGDKRYAVAHFNDPKNPMPLQYSTRSYGRFGAFSKAEVKPDAPLNLRYRITITDGAKSKAAADWQKEWDAFAAGR